MQSSKPKETIFTGSDGSLAYELNFVDRRFYIHGCSFSYHIFGRIHPLLGPMVCTAKYSDILISEAHLAEYFLVTQKRHATIIRR